MGESTLEQWTGLGAFFVGIVIGIAMLALHLFGADPILLGPTWLWWICFVAFVATQAAPWWARHRLRAPWPGRIAAVQVTLASALVALSGQTGWVPILLIFSAANMAQESSRRATIATVVVQTSVLVATVTAVSTHTFEAMFPIALYTLLQAVTVGGIWQDLEQAEVRDGLAAANVELRAARALLAEQSRTRERLRIARELHDLVGHQLTALTLELEVASHQVTAPASEHVTRARRIARDLLNDVRSAVGELRTRTPELGTALQSLAREIPRPRVHVEVAQDVQTAEPQIEALFRCAQEIVTNAIRHADADHVWIDVAAPNGEIVMTARDDGSGADALRIGHGLSGLHERVSALGGTVDIDPSRGFRVEIRVPSR